MPGVIWGDRVSAIRARAVVALSAFLLALTLVASIAAVASASTPAFSAHGSVEQVYVTGLSPYARMSLLNRAGRKVASERADALGGVLFRDVRPGSGYRVRLSSGGPESGPLTVLSTRSAPPSTSIYDQKIPTDGYGYLTTRDGTKLAIDVRLPTDIASQLGVPITLPNVGAPYPTLIEYSGYGYADPSGPQNGIAILANLMGFAVVDVNMRGTPAPTSTRSIRRRSIAGATSCSCSSPSRRRSLAAL